VENDMKEQDYELLSQYIDGELAADQAQTLRHRLMSEPELRAAYDQLCSVNDEIRETFNAPGLDAVPPRVSALLENGRAASQSRRAGWGFAVAASLLAATGLLLNPDWRQTDSDVQFASVLDSTPSGIAEWEMLEDGRQLKPVLSFAHVDGSWCREFLLNEDGATYRGIACRSDQNWVTTVLDAQDAPGSATEYRPAGAGDSDKVATFIADNASGIALSRTEESDLIARRWQ
jgi:hypothetical protein